MSTPVNTFKHDGYWCSKPEIPSGWADWEEAVRSVPFCPYFHFSSQRRAKQFARNPRKYQRKSWAKSIDLPNPLSGDNHE